MKNQIVIAIMGLFMALTNISFAGSTDTTLPECCRKQEACCVKDAACCAGKDASSASSACCEKKEACCESKDECCGTAKAEENGKGHSHSKGTHKKSGTCEHHKAGCCK